MRKQLVPILILVVLFGGWFVLRPKATNFTAGESLEAVLAGDQPILLEFFGST